MLLLLLLLLSSLCPSAFLQAMEQACPNGHRLQPIRLPQGVSVVCDRCNVAHVNAHLVMGCRRCDWDICSACLATAAATRGVSSQPAVTACRACRGRGRRGLLGPRGLGICSRRCRHCVHRQRPPVAATPAIQPRQTAPATSVPDLQARQALRGIGSWRHARQRFLDRLDGVNPTAGLAEVFAATDDGICAVCLDRAVDTVLQPCGHAATCGECTRRLPRMQTGGGNSWQRCPICGVCVATVVPAPARHLREQS